MGYRIIISPRAQQEIIEAIDYYTQKSLLTPSNFIASLDEVYHVLLLSPYFRICYSNVRVIPLNNFPYSIFYVINEQESKIRILSCFHTSQQPNKNPKR